MLSQPSDASSSYPTSVELQQPTLSLLNSLLSSVTIGLERAAEEKSLILNKVKMQRNLSFYLLHSALVYIIACLLWLFKQHLICGCADSRHKWTVKAGSGWNHQYVCPARLGFIFRQHTEKVSHNAVVLEIQKLTCPWN